MDHLNIHLLINGRHPEEAIKDFDLREEIKFNWLENYENLVIYSSKQADCPDDNWEAFIRITSKSKIHNFCVIFLKINENWLALTFGNGRRKLKKEMFVRDFGLKVALNAVDEERMRTLRTHKRHDGIHVFRLDYLQEILKYFGRKPEKTEFVSSVKSSDKAVIIRRGIPKEDIPNICKEALKLYGQEDYKKNFDFIDNYEMISDNKLLKKLNKKVKDAMNEALRGNIPSELDLTCPAKTIRPMRFKITRKIEHKVIEKQVPIDIENYIDALKDMDIDGKKRKYLLNYLENHHIEKLMSPNKLEVKPEGFDYEDYEEDFTAAEVSKHDGTWEKIKMIKDCLIYEVHEEIRGEIFIYILSEGYWVRLKNDFIKRMDEVVEEAKKIWNDTKLFLPPYNHKDEVDYIKHVEQQQHESPGWSGITSTSRTGKEPELLHPEPGTSHNGNSLITERNL